MNKYKFIIALLIPFLIIACFNWHPNAASAIKNLDYGGKRIRWSAAHRARKVQATAAFIGTSRTLKFTPKLYKKINAEPAINLSLYAATTIEQRYMLEHAENIRPLRTAVIELTYYYFDQGMKKQFSMDRLNVTETMQDPWKRFLYTFYPMKDFYSLVFSYTSTLENFEMRRKYWPFLDKTMNGYFTILKKVQKEWAKDEKNPKLKEENGMIALREILEISAKNGTQIHFYIPPIAARLEERFYGTKWETLENWKRTLIDSIEKHNAMHNTDVKLWDFSGFNSITTSTFAEGSSQNEWYLDLAHFNKEVAEMIFDRLYETCSDPCNIPQDFGVLLSQENIDGHLEIERSKRADFLRNYEGLIQMEKGSEMMQEEELAE